MSLIAKGDKVSTTVTQNSNLDTWCMVLNLWELKFVFIFFHLIDKYHKNHVWAQLHERTCVCVCVWGAQVYSRDSGFINLTGEIRSK